MDKYGRYFKLWSMGLLAVFLMAGCGGGGGTGSASSQTGTLSVSLTDAPASVELEAVNVTISKVRVHKSSDAEEDDAGWSEIILEPARKINLLDLQNGVLEDLGETQLPVGHYTQLRLVLVANTETDIANSVVLRGKTTEIPLVTPSAVQSGIKLINEFDVTAEEPVVLVLDFDALKSVVKRGNGTYALKPVIKVIPTALNGITGFINNVGDDGQSVSNVMVTAQVNGEIVRSTTPTQSGEFLLARLEAGDYDVVITADGYATAVIAGVPVTDETSITTLSTSVEPIIFPTSATPPDPATHSIIGTVTLAPPGTTEVAYVTAKQTLNGGPTVTIKDQNVALTDLTGAYELMLPIAAPWLFEYVADDPINFIEQNDAAGIYTVEASTTGYMSEESGVLDISLENKTHDFELTAVTP